MPEKSGCASGRILSSKGGACGLKSNFWQDVKSFMSKAFVMLAVLVFLIGSGAAAAEAKEPATPEMSLKDAVLKAWSVSEEVKAAQRAVDKAEEQRDNAADSVDFIPAPLSATPQGDVVWSMFQKADINWQVSKKDLELKRDNVAIDVFTKYYAVVAAQDALKKAEVAVARDEQALQVARAMYRAGMTTNAAVSGAEAKAESSRKALAAAKEDLDKAYVAFNRLVGLWPEDRPVLTEKLEFSPLQIDSIDYEAQRAVESSKQIWMLKKKVDVEKLDVDYPWDVGLSGFSWKYYDVERPDVDIAELNVASAANTIKEQVRSLYHDIRSAEEQYTSLQAALKAAEENLRVARIMFDAGMTTQDKVKEAEAACAELSNNMVMLTYKHEVMKANFRLLTGDAVVDIS